MESRKLVDAVLSNVVILDNIFRFSTFPKKLRLVCKQWNDVILSRKYPLFALNLGSVPFEENREEFEQLLNSMDSRLFKLIHIFRHDHYVLIECDEDKGPVNQIPIKLRHICEKLGPHIRQLVIVWWPEIVTALYTIFGDGLCPNLTILVISVANSDPNKYQLTSRRPFLPARNELPKISEMSHLNKIKFIYARHKKRDEIRMMIFVTTFFQYLLNASPRLQKLDVNSFHCPFLESNKEIKELRFEYNYKNMPWNITDPANPIVNFSLKNLSNILAQVKDSLEMLQLKKTSRLADGKYSLKIPIMPKLGTFLYLDTALCDGLSPDFRPLLSYRMPSLVHLAVPLQGEESYENASGVLDNLLLFQNSKINRLRLTQVPMRLGYGFFQKLTGLRKAFPDLECLSLSLWGREEGAVTASGRYHCGQKIGKTLEACSNLRLSHFRIKTNFNYGLSEMVEGLWGARRDLFSCLKTLQVINNHLPDTLVSDDLSPAGEIMLQEILIMTKVMTSLIFVGFLMRFDHAKRLSDFISENKLPVRFIY